MRFKGRTLKLLAVFLLCGIILYFIIYQRREIHRMTYYPKLELDVSVDVDKQYDVSPLHYTGQKLNTSVWTNCKPPLDRSIGLDRNQAKSYTNLISYVNRSFTAGNVSIVIVGGAAIGSYLFHDYLPWDDDVDLNILDTDIPKVVKFLIHMIKTTDNGLYVHEYEHSEISLFRWSCDNRTDISHRGEELTRVLSDTTKLILFKIFRCRDNYAGRYIWKFPFADISIFQSNKTHLWQIADKKIYLKEKIFPTKFRPLNSEWFPTPRDTLYYLRTLLPEFWCMIGIWDHDFELPQKETKYDCASITKCYPIVYRYPHRQGSLEVLALNGMVLHKVIIPGKYDRNLLPKQPLSVW
ncbi:unnamed protein product [Owenia fusiformis]|uniref:Uncharacterized protein n=1 Tax=Owenia fusiformis TaxID=6347 RepID=A0A8J1XGG5_OWEFU|nr:unnamed protein product [Owenia fusiformis]